MLRRLILSLTVPAATYVTAQRVRRLICQEFLEVFKKVQVIAAPTAPAPASTIGDHEKGFVEIEGRRMPLQDWGGPYWTLGTIPFNVTGLPALSICCGFSSSGLPMGLQIVAAPFQEEMVFRVAHAYERAAGWYRRRPPTA